MRHPGSLLVLLVAFVAPVSARHEIALCGTTAETAREQVFLHRQSLRGRTTLRPRAVAAPSANRDAGNVAIIEDSDGVVARQNQFNLDLKTLQFAPDTAAAARYRYSVSDGGYDDGAAAQGTPLAALDDDDSRTIDLPWAFPFFGVTYRQAFVNSDGNLTFVAADHASADRSLGRMTAGPPRISPLFDDLDPSRTAGGVRVFSDASRLVVSWMNVPEWDSGQRQTFQVRLYPDGLIEFSYSSTAPTDQTVVGIAPGELKGTTAIVDFWNDASAQYTAALVERFGATLEIDTVTAAEKFYQTHEDSYDYLVIYNNMDIGAGPSAVAVTNAVRRVGAGYGPPEDDTGKMYGSPSRLKAVLNLGMLRQYPANPNGVVPSRGQAGDTPVTVIGHEAGHLFLAFASVPDPADPTLTPMLGYQKAHWAFTFNSEASLMEGERILDRGPDVTPRFLTTDTVQEYAPLDQYLMGFRAPQDVPDTFYVAGTLAGLSDRHPASGVGFDGTRRNVTIGDVIQAMGRRTPDHTVAQRRFRFAFLLIVPPGTEPSATDMAKIENYRQEFEAFFGKAASGNAGADTSLKRSLKLSIQPAAGVVAGTSAAAVVSVEKPVATATTVQFQSANGSAKFPDSVQIPAGAASASVVFSGVKPGVEEVTAIPADPAYETAYARVQVAGAAVLRLVAVATFPGPVVVRVTDANGLAYPNARLAASASAGGAVEPAAAMTDAQGQATFRWTPGPLNASRLQIEVKGLDPPVTLNLATGAAVPVITAVVNAASYAEGVAAGALATILGTGLTQGADPQVLLNDVPVRLLYAGGTQINFYVPSETRLGQGTLTVIAGGERVNTGVNVSAIQPGIFPGAVLHAGTAVNAVTTPVTAGDYIEIYCTGLGPTRSAGGLQRTTVAPTVFIGAVPVTPVFSGLTSIPGLYQVNVRVPAGTGTGLQTVLISANLFHSNQIQIAVQ
jgi:uncharacterized protein (TIGR03437 family)